MMTGKSRRPWRRIFSEAGRRACAAAGFGRPSGFVQQPPSTMIDVRHWTVGAKPAGCMTSGCVHGSAVDAFACNCRVFTPDDAASVHSATSLVAKFIGMASHCADVMPTVECVRAERMQA